MKLKNGNVSGAEDPVAVITQDGVEKIETDDVTVLAADTFGVHLTQAETGRLSVDAETRLYINWIESNERKAIRGAALTVEENHPSRELNESGERSSESGD